MIDLENRLLCVSVVCIANRGNGFRTMPPTDDKVVPRMKNQDANSGYELTTFAAQSC